MNEVGVEIVKTEETEENEIKYLNINVSNSEVERNPDIVRLCADAGILEYVKLKTGHCKDCKYFEYDSLTKVDGIPIIAAHEICSRWGDGCKTREDGYCFLFESQKNEDK